MTQTIGKVHSIQTLGTLDGPGVRFVVFTQGCNLRCHCCHNPDTWECGVGKEYTPEQILAQVNKYRAYFGQKGGITFSGGEPLLQAQFVYETFRLCKENGINTCLDTSGSVMNDEVKKLLSVTDRVLLDVKYTTDELYRKYVGCSFDSVISFLETLEKMHIKTTVRQVVIPTVNTYDENFKLLKGIVEKYDCIDSFELLPFRKICTTKYEAMGIDFPFAKLDEATNELIEKYKNIME